MEDKEEYGEEERMEEKQNEEVEIEQEKQELQPGTIGHSTRHSMGMVIREASVIGFSFYLSWGPNNNFTLLYCIMKCLSSLLVM